MAASHAAHTCRLCLGIRIPRALGVGVGHVLLIPHVRFVMVGHWINGSIIIVNARMLSAVNHLHAMLVISLRQLPTPPFVSDLHEVRISPASFPSPSPPSEGSEEGSEAPSVNNIVTVNVDEPRVSPPTSMPSLEHGERERDTSRVGNGEGEAASTSIASAGGREEPPRPQPDPLDDKFPSSPIKFRPKISVHHVDDWGENGEDRPPSPTSPQPQTKRKREERERAIDHTRAADFYEKSARCRSPPRERPQFLRKIRQVPLSSQRAPTTAWLRLPLGACPPAVSLRAGIARRGFTHPLGPNPSLRCTRRVRRAYSSPAGPSILLQICRLGQPIFMKNSPVAAPLPGSARNRMITTADQRLPARGLPPCRHCPQGIQASIGA